MRLCLIRHGIAIDREDPECPPEPERFLTREGQLRTRQAMRGLHALGVKPGAILTSPYVRAAQTAKIAAKELGLDASRIHSTEALLPGADPSELFRELADLEEPEIACCGHAPNLDEVIAHAVGARRAFTALKKAGTAGVDFENVRAGSGVLVWLYPAGLLRRFRT